MATLIQGKLYDQIYHKERYKRACDYCDLYKTICSGYEDKYDCYSQEDYYYYKLSEEQIAKDIQEQKEKDKMLEQRKWDLYREILKEKLLKINIPLEDLAQQVEDSVNSYLKLQKKE